METRHTKNLVAAGPTFDFILVPFLQICFSFSSPCASPFRFCVIWYYFFFFQFGRVNCNWPLHFLCQSTRQPKTSRRTAADNEKKVPGLTKKIKDQFLWRQPYGIFRLPRIRTYTMDLVQLRHPRKLFQAKSLWILLYLDLDKLPYRKSPRSRLHCWESHIFQHAVQLIIYANNNYIPRNEEITLNNLGM